MKRQRNSSGIEVAKELGEELRLKSLTQKKREMDKHKQVNFPD